MGNNTTKIELAGTFAQELDSTVVVTIPTNNSDTSFDKVNVTPFYFGNIINDYLFSRPHPKTGQNWLRILAEDYAFGIVIKLVSLSAYYHIPSMQLTPFVDFGDDDTDAQKTAKLLDSYHKFEKMGLKMWSHGLDVSRYVGSAFDVTYGNLDTFSGGASRTWKPRGETILQNKGFEVKINLLPYLGTTYIDCFGGFGIEMIDKGNGILRDGDYVNVVGEWEGSVTFMPKVTGVVSLLEVLK